MTRQVTWVQLELPVANSVSWVELEIPNPQAVSWVLLEVPDAPATSLSVRDAIHQHRPDGVSLVVDLAVSGSRHSHPADNVALGRGTNAPIPAFYFAPDYFASPYWGVYWADPTREGVVGGECPDGYWHGEYWSQAYYNEEYWSGTCEAEVEILPPDYGSGIPDKLPRIQKRVRQGPKKQVETPRVFGPWIDLDKRDEERRQEAHRIAAEALSKALIVSKSIENEAWMLITAIALAESEERIVRFRPAPKSEEEEVADLMAALAQL